MGATFNITPVGGSTITFAELKDKTARSALSMSTGSPLKDLAVWHIPGTTGNVVCDLGYKGQQIVCVALYTGVYATAIGNYEADKTLFSADPCTIVDPAGLSHYRCRLVDSREQLSPKGYKDIDVYCLFTVNFVFDQHGLS